MTTPAGRTRISANDRARPTPTPARLLPASLVSDTATSRIDPPGRVTLDRMNAVYRQRQLAIGLGASRAIAALWAQHIRPEQMADSWASIRDIVLQLIRQFHDAASSDSAKTYEQMRVLADLPFRGASMARLPRQELVRVADSQAMGTFFHNLPGMPEPTAADSAGRALEAATARLALKGGRQTMLAAVNSDPLATGWERIISGSACSFCSMLASRGAVYKSQKTADFRAHDHCNCTAQPVFHGQEVSRQSRNLAAQWQQVTRGASGAAARQAWQKHWEASHGRSDSTTAQESPQNRAGNGSQQPEPV